jgi:hypothetical protein
MPVANRERDSTCRMDGARGGAPKDNGTHSSMAFIPPRRLGRVA